MYTNTFSNHFAAYCLILLNLWALLDVEKKLGAGLWPLFRSNLTSGQNFGNNQLFSFYQKKKKQTSSKSSFCPWSETLTERMCPIMTNCNEQSIHNLILFCYYPRKRTFHPWKKHCNYTQLNGIWCWSRWWMWKMRKVVLWQSEILRSCPLGMLSFCNWSNFWLMPRRMLAMTMINIIMMKYSKHFWYLNYFIMKIFWDSLFSLSATGPTKWSCNDNVMSINPKWQGLLARKGILSITYQITYSTIMPLLGMSGPNILQYFSYYEVFQNPISPESNAVKCQEGSSGGLKGNLVDHDED